MMKQLLYYIVLLLESRVLELGICTVGVRVWAGFLPRSVLGHTLGTAAWNVGIVWTSREAWIDITFLVNAYF